MSSGNPTSDPLEPLNLPSSIRVQADKLLLAIRSGRTLPDTLRAADRAEGFALGLDTVRVLHAIDVEGLYRAFDDAAQIRLAELL
ncbi:hypothetical protein OH720_18330 [Pseudomonas sp. WJP1]|uniref:hypothetical protein n=1 Tax=Pseudomonas sp. WJP1 TaxID=2986947 RepID=UPI00234BCF77|nr:hypothetical protein [Pseudomonas sp. WJP1]WCM48969.1 hypothetical protein OH720_18330 [Pseudomonas sp. WJP1]